MKIHDKRMMQGTAWAQGRAGAVLCGGWRSVGVGISLLMSVCGSALSAEDAPRSPERVEHLRDRLLVLESGGGAVELPESDQTETEVAEPQKAESAAPAEVPEQPLPTGWRNAGAWDRITTELTKEQVVEILGKPERVLRSMDSGVDLVYYYEQTIHRNWVSQLRGHVNFKSGKVVSIERPEFQ